MIGYVTLGTNDLPRAAQFYDALLQQVGAARTFETDRLIMWSKEGILGLGVIKPFDGNAATTSNGGMLGIAVGNRAEVDALHQKALALGGSDEGAPGERMPNFYVGYFRDLDGNKLNVFFMG